MNVNLQFAILTFNPDLTDPLLEPIPVGVVAVGTLTPTQGFCFVAAARRSSVAVDHDSFGLLSDLGGLMGKLIQEGLNRAGHAGLLRWLAASLGNTLALGQPMAHSMSLETEPTQIDELLPALASLYEEHVSDRRGVGSALPAVRFDVLETPA